MGEGFIRNMLLLFSLLLYNDYSAQFRISEELSNRLPDYFEEKSLSLSLDEVNELTATALFYDATFYNEFYTICKNIEEKLPSYKTRHENIIAYHILINFYFHYVYDDTKGQQEFANKTIRYSKKLETLLGNDYQDYKAEKFVSNYINGYIYLMDEHNKQFDKVIYYFYSALELKDHVDKSLWGSVHWDLTLCYFLTEDFSKASENIDLAKHYSKEGSFVYHLNNNDEYSISFLKIEILLFDYHNRGDEQLLTDAKNLLTDLNEKYQILNHKDTYYPIAWSLLKAFSEYLEKDYTAFENSVKEISSNYSYKDLKHYNSIENFLMLQALLSIRKESDVSLLDLNVNSPFVPYERIFYKELYRLYKEHKNYYMTTQVLEKLNQIDSIQDLYKFNIALTEGNIRYDTRKKAFELEKIKNEKKLSTIKTNFVIFILLLLLIVSVVFFLYRNHRNKLISLKKEKEYNLRTNKMFDYLTHLEKNFEIDKLNFFNSKKVEIGESLHNEVLSGIVGVDYLIKDLIKTMPDDQSKEALHIIEEELKSVYTEARSFSHQLVYNSANEKDFIDIKEYILTIKTKFEEIGILNIQYECNDEKKLSNLSYKIKTTIYHILKEAISNTLKHAKSNNITISINIEDTKCILHLYNDGIIDQEINKKVGLNSLIKRTQNLNGTIQFRKENNHFYMDAEIPVI